MKIYYIRRPICIRNSTRSAFRTSVLLSPRYAELPRHAHREQTTADLAWLIQHDGRVFSSCVIEQ